MRAPHRCVRSGVVLLLTSLSWPAYAGTGGEAAPVRKVADAYVKAINRADAVAAAACWTDDGEFTNASTGRRVKGRQAILKALQEALAPDAGIQAETTASSIHVVAPGVAVEEG